MAAYPRPRVDPASYNQGLGLLKHCFSLNKPGAAMFSIPPCHTLVPHPNTVPLPFAEDSRGAGLKLPLGRRWDYQPMSQANRKVCVSPATLVARQSEPPYVCLKIASPSLLIVRLEELAKKHSLAETDLCSVRRQHSPCRMDSQNHRHVHSSYNHTRSTVPVPFHHPRLSPNPILLHQIPIPTSSNMPCDYTIHKGHPVSLCSQGNVTPQTPEQPQQSPNSSNKATPSQLSFILLKLREELPAFFEGHHSFDMYAPDMTFENNLSRHAWTQRGRSNYKAFLSCSRAMLYSYYTNVQLDLLKITKEVEGAYIEARWRVCGKPRLRWGRDERVVVEGFSTFVVNADGLICTHRMDKVMPAGKERGRIVSWVAVLLGLAPPPPAIELEPQPP